MYWNLKNNKVKAQVKVKKIIVNGNDSPRSVNIFMPFTIG